MHLLNWLKLERNKCAYIWSAGGHHGTNQIGRELKGGGGLCGSQYVFFPCADMLDHLCFYYICFEKNAWLCGFDRSCLADRSGTRIPFLLIFLIPRVSFCLIFVTVFLFFRPSQVLGRHGWNGSFKRSNRYYDQLNRTPSSPCTYGSIPERCRYIFICLHKRVSFFCSKRFFLSYFLVHSGGLWICSYVVKW